MRDIGRPVDLTAGIGAATLPAVPEIVQRGSEPMSVTETASGRSERAGTPVLLRRDEAGVAWLTLNRPEQRNALSVALMTALQSEIDAIASDKAIKVVVIGGAGSAFSAGHDLREMRANPTREFYAERFQQSTRLMLSLVRLPKPLIASVRGIATAAGCQLAASCDLVIASDEARFATPGVNIGLFCSTPMVPLSRAVGRKAAMEMLLTGDFVSAARAREIGLVNRVVPAEGLDHEASALARKIAGKSALTLAIGKEAFYRQAELPLAEAYAYASEVMTRNMLARDAEEGIDAFLEKRPPQWEDR
jgi:enoyl-CoA hydratase/carnithine racemase